MPDATFASLSPSLLARKGGAKPAMRPQHAALASMPNAAPAEDPEKLEDLGWNDMGDNDDHAHVAEVVTLTPAVRAVEPAAVQGPAPEPEVLRQRETVAERLAAPAPKAKRPAKDRAAFTLRLDTERHVKLRLACTMLGVSAQALVTEALDALLGTMPELDTMAAQVKRR